MTQILSISLERDNQRRVKMAREDHTEDSVRAELHGEMRSAQFPSVSESGKAASVEGSTGDIRMTRPPNRYRPTDALSVAEAVFKPATPVAVDSVPVKTKGGVPVPKESVVDQTDSDLMRPVRGADILVRDASISDARVNSVALKA